ncbi:MAG: class I SAM-dependent rRNA methyltransferase [Chloroflexi bacterium]|uniref:23S rRNA (Cytosine(1962)-C(5))-methyltransferase RlmI n=1 Tax=Candidatus Thermofonsia Clade 3 bacterium TaxID=2364212 RepID=A0A2M8QAG1_9CHLR|nr:class I SAM-dependent rRNA methyltransferase [Candidatus Roseilinea sp. NK_OTU-006]PJF46772.1 MAG: 23S rRNA (cytosine(1962)-C(5))-methyltransferase RlmI [Candidatus Thermofonsia Clade 3 bacterium]RMG64780.1 MAG: class I SAM-dependent rRNA methyltransferase [Chloroflexota bacterium]
MSSAVVTLKSGRDRSVRQRHPRLFAGAIKEISGRPKDGDVVDVTDNRSEWLARGVINQQAQIAVRLLTWARDEVIDEAFWRRRVHAAIARRKRDPALAHTNAIRWVFGESDGLPGLIVDGYADVLVVEISALVAWRALPVLTDALNETLSPRQIRWRADEERLSREFGGTLPRAVRAALSEAAPAEPVEIGERGLRFWVNPAGGQKTGFYLDQRDNRARVAAYCQGATVLNAFAYTGAFGLHALVGGATRVVNVDSSGEALALAERNLALNGGLGAGRRYECVEADVFDYLRGLRDCGERFDVVILDPPKFAHHPGQVERAARAYKDLNRVGMSIVEPGGILATFSCSGVVDAALFQKIVFSAALEAGRDARVIERLTQASDHPVLLTFPESEYLKGLICRIE